jgi:5-methylcytosine-specific restriction endonuclease McrA
MTFQHLVDAASMQAAADAVPEQCACQRTEVRERMIRGGSKQYVKQCLDCGESVGNPVRQTAAVRPFDEGLRAYAREQRNALIAQAKESASAFWWAEYHRYMASAEWRSMREKVMERDGRLCQGCLSSRATEVHHRSYEHFAHEFAFELISLCHACHERMHATDGSNG